MLGRALVAPLDDGWLRTLDAVAAARGWPTTRQAARLGAAVAALSASYNDPTRARASAREAGAARLGFSFARDVPKSAGAVRELVALGQVRREGTLTVLDVGAGLGATTWGVVRALQAAGARLDVEATWVDDDAEALAVGQAIVRERERASPSPSTSPSPTPDPHASPHPSGDAAGGVRLRVRTVARAAGPLDELGRFDLVLAGQVLSELDVGADPEERVARHAALLGGWVARRLAPGGSLVVVEPALRDRTRHLHRVRDALVASTSVASASVASASLASASVASASNAPAAVTVFAPCLHAAACPMLARDTDWCHEDLDVDLPEGLVPVARAAGLRREGLTFSYLVLRADGVSLASCLEATASTRGALRVVSGPMPSKGKREAFLCGPTAAPAPRDEADGTATPTAPPTPATTPATPSTPTAPPTPATTPAPPATPATPSTPSTKLRAMRLDRDARPGNAAWDAVARGDLVIIEPRLPQDRPRIGAEARVRRLGDLESR